MVQGVGVADGQEHRHGRLVGLNSFNDRQVQVDLPPGGKGVVAALELLHSEAQPLVAVYSLSEVPNWEHRRYR